MNPEIPEVIADIVTFADTIGASDLLLASDRPAYARIAGRLKPITLENGDPVQISLQHLQELRANLGTTSRTGAGATIKDTRARFTVYDDVRGIRAAIRIIPSVPPEATQLGLPQSTAPIIGLSSGLVIVCGPTSAGKTTTLACLARQIIMTRPMHVITLESPVEYLLDMPSAGDETLGASQLAGAVSQRHLPRTPEKRELATISVLSSNPDVIVFSELHTPEDAKWVLQCAASGHLVLAGLHAADTVTACERVVGMAGEPMRAMLAQTIRMIVSQRLIPSAGEDRRRWLAAEVASFDNMPRCRQYVERGEVVPLRTEIINQRTHLDRSLAKRVAARQISQASALAACIDRTELENQIIETRKHGRASIQSASKKRRR